MRVKRTNFTTLTHRFEYDQKSLSLQAGSHYIDVPPTLVKSSALVNHIFQRFFFFNVLY